MKEYGSALAVAIADAHADGQGCSASTTTCALTDTTGACCVADVEGYTKSKAKDALAKAGACCALCLQLKELGSSCVDLC